MICQTELTDPLTSKKLKVGIKIMNRSELTLYAPVVF